MKGDTRVHKQEFLNRWLEIIKKSSAVLIYKQDFVGRLLTAVRNCATRHTYDPAWTRALVEVVMETETGPGGSDLEVDLRSVAARMIKYYWNQTIFFNLAQGANPCRQPDLIRRVRELICEYFESRRSREPVRFENANFNPPLRKKLEEHFDAAGEILKNDVVHSFLGKGRLHGEFINHTRGEDSLLLPQNAAAAIRENSALITEAIYYRWAQILEKYNSSPRLNRKVRIIDTPELRDRPLSYFAKYLDLENPGRQCFLCGQPVEDQDLVISHVIPWSYLCSDDIWNLVYTHKDCHFSKSGPFPSEFFIARLEKRNKALLAKLAGYAETDMVAGMLQEAVSRNLVRKNWICCQ
ncbi:MAG: HNH endonuclease [Peptococcaceae bacterium]|nr:HNH endonuclease [Peptococcaceae bacterium]